MFSKQIKSFLEYIFEDFNTIDTILLFELRICLIVPLSFLISLTHSLTQVIRKFAKQLDEWLKIALHDLPENLRNIKFECKYNDSAPLCHPIISDTRTPCDSRITVCFLASSVPKIFSDS